MTTPRVQPLSSWVRATILATTLLPAVCFAQAGLSGDPLSGQTAEREGRNSQFDNGKLKSTSALGQLEEISGGTVDRSSNKSSYRNTTTRPAQPVRPAKPRYDPNQEMRQQVAGAVAGALIGALFADNSAQERANAEAAAARAAAEAEAQAEALQVQQELARQARIQKAQHYRAEWDSRESEVGERLGGAFDVGNGTAFFGQPARPDADTVAAILGQDTGATTQAPDEAPEAYAAAPSVVDLQGSSLVVQLSPQPRPAATHARRPVIPPSPKQAPATQKSDDNWQEDKPAPDPIIVEKYRKWWAKNHPYLDEKLTELELSYVFMAVSGAGGDSVQALAKLPEKIKESLDLKKNISKHAQEYVGSLFSIARQATNPRADYDNLSGQVFDRFETTSTNFQDDATKGTTGNFYLRIGGTLPEGSPQEAGMGIAQGLSSDLPERMAWGRDVENRH